ncbi:ATP-binding protein [Nocardia neocaledoniensis]|uniref:Histidine kinase-like protein n=1 Tax=Nocardia neocaledoniensis TaxID=236511 RepID=A0A317NNW4_9NOCA|nr:histidine kinase-like protein [Nocardia neocaledoniensis]
MLCERFGGSLTNGYWYPVGSAGLDLDLDAVAAGSARARVRELLEDLPPTVVADVVQVMDELTSNARLHGAAPRRCRVRLRPQRVRVEVDDTDPGRPRPRAPQGTGGRGLILVDRLATAWACTAGRDRKTVWAELDLEPRHPA